MKKKIQLITAALLFSTVIVQAQNDRKIAESTVSKEGVKAKVAFLASDELRGRDTPSHGQEVAAKFISTQLLSYGVKTLPGMDSFYQPVKMVATSGGAAGTMSIGDSLYDFAKDMILISGAAAEVDGGVVYVGYGTKEDFEGVDVKGKIVIANAGAKGETSARTAFRAGEEKAILAEELGALALVELYNLPQPTWKILQFYLSSSKVRLDMSEEDEEETTFPRVWLEDMENTKKAFFETYTGSASLKVEDATENAFTAFNIVGMVQGTDPDLKNEYVIYSAHYDHVGVGEPNAEGDSIFNGTRDNAIGSATVLEAAANIAKNPMKRSALFIFFTGEEKGLLGSQWYVANPLLPLDQMVYCFNSDNAGYNNTEIATIIGLPRTSAKPLFEKACAAFGLEAKDDPVPDQNLYDRSDHVSFARAGIPAIMFTLGLTAFDEEIMTYYHRQADNPDTVDYDYIFDFTKAYVYGCRLIGNAKEAPEWTAGDKYEEAGKALYEN